MLGIKPGEVLEGGQTWIGPAPWIEITPPGPNSQAVISRQRRLGTPVDSATPPLVIYRGLGSVIQDVDGNRYLDFAAGLAAAATGHCHPKVAEAIEAQARTLVHTPGSDVLHPPIVELSEKLAGLLPDEPFDRVLPTSGGREAVSVSIRLAQDYTERRRIIALGKGSPIAATGSTSLTCSEVDRPGWFDAVQPGVEYVPFGSVEVIESQLSRSRLSPDNVAAVLVETIRVEGDCILGEAAFFHELRAWCDTHRILLVCDEIRSGAGRTGKWFAFEHMNILPDIVALGRSLASGMPLGAVLTRAEIADSSADVRAGGIGGNPVCCAAALATVDLINSTFRANAELQGRGLLKRLAEIEDRKRIVGQVRGIGLMCAFDIVSLKTQKPSPATRDRLLRHCFERGLLLRACGTAGILLCPPLCINEAQIDVGLRVLEEALSAAS
ncbi:MAG: aminotransferase class III-fold pyridoxal phosphate-dependent enzyme [Planctomycetes bacterium]|nr:aminotransferase class III-fold pyridoxal phosphate-dependent enzyme [Planctomycetota bacterium]